MPKATMTMLATLAPYATGAAQAMMKTLAKSPRLTAHVFSKMGGERAALAHTTVAATQISGGTASHQLPVHATAHIVVRIAAGETTTSALGRIRARIADSKVTCTMIEGSDPSTESSTANSQYKAITQAIEASYPGVVCTPYYMMTPADARHFHPISPAVYRFTPLAMSPAQRASMHGVDEYVEVDSLKSGQAFYEHLIRSTASASG
jgi:carboxypeptidase PM20D1